MTEWRGMNGRSTRVGLGKGLGGEMGLVLRDIYAVVEDLLNVSGY